MDSRTRTVDYGKDIKEIKDVMLQQQEDITLLWSAIRTLNAKIAELQRDFKIGF